MKTNTHGLKITGLRKIASDSKNLTDYYSGHYIQINYDLTTGEAWGDYHYSLGQNSFSVYHDQNIVVCGNISTPHTMQQIADLIYRSAEWRKI